ncbi:MAG TPA: hypothetical protein VJG64_02340 [Candidatus Paceibacterota bacterium]
MVRRQKVKKKKKSSIIDFPLIEEIKYRIKAHSERRQLPHVVDEDDPLVTEKEATEYLDHEKHGAD